MSTNIIKPLADRVLVEPSKTDEKTHTGIIIPDTAKEKPQKGYRDRYWSRRHRLGNNSNTRG